MKTFLKWALLAWIAAILLVSPAASQSTEFWIYDDCQVILRAFDSDYLDLTKHPQTAYHDWWSNTWNKPWYQPCYGLGNCPVRLTFEAWNAANQRIHFKQITGQGRWEAARYFPRETGYIKVRWELYRTNKDRVEVTQTYEHSIPCTYEQDPMLFTDGFESGNLDAWTRSKP